ncbi:MAG: hypothetical protein ABI625_25275, partial [bacterium]
TGYVARHSPLINMNIPFVHRRGLRHNSLCDKDIGELSPLGPVPHLNAEQGSVGGFFRFDGKGSSRVRSEPQILLERCGGSVPSEECNRS